MRFQEGRTWLSILKAKVHGFHLIQELYKEDPYFKGILEGDLKGSPYTTQEGYLFKNNKLCVSRGSLRELLVHEAHGGTLVDLLA